MRRALRQARGLARGLTGRGPVYAMVQLTARCNLRCRMCQVWALEHGEADELDTAGLRRVARILSDCGISVVSLAGEPLLRDDLPEVVSAFARFGLTVRLQTNGIGLDGERMRALLDAGLTGASVSLHSLRRDHMAWLTGRDDALERVLEGVEAIGEAARSRRDFLGIVNAVLHPGNLDELSDLERLAARRGLRLSLIPIHASPLRGEEPQFTPRLPRELAFRPGDGARVRAAVRSLAGHLWRQRTLLNSSRYLALLPDFVDGRAVDWPCRAGSLYVFVDHAGRVAPCHELEPAGSLFDPLVACRLADGDLGAESRDARSACPGCLLPCWSELSLMFASPMAFLQALEVNLGGAASARGARR